jgi:RNA polymerase sigma-70 factor, ECF subfamily
MNRPVFRNAQEVVRPARLDRDRGLVEAARRDPADFDALYRKYLAQVYSYAFYELRDHHAAEDATEKTFMAALTGLPRFEERADAFIGARGSGTSGAGTSGSGARGSASGSGGGSGPSGTSGVTTEFPADASTFRVWLFRIARNVVANERRRERRRPVAPLEHAAGVPAADDIFETAAAREAGSAAWRAVGRLPEDRRRAVVLRFVDEMSTAEIAEILGRSEGAVRVLLHRALRSVAADLAAPGRAAPGGAAPGSAAPGRAAGTSSGGSGGTGSGRAAPGRRGRLS